MARKKKVEVTKDMQDNPNPDLSQGQQAQPENPDAPPVPDNEGHYARQRRLRSEDEGSGT